MSLGIYRVTLGICLASPLTIFFYFAFVLPTFGGMLILSMAQCAVYCAIGFYAWQCRDHNAGSRIVLAMALLASLLSAVMAKTLSIYGGFGLIYFGLLQYTQTALAVVGCYVGYALVERHRLQQSNPGSAKGKLVVVCLLATAALAVATLLVIATRGQ